MATPVDPSHYVIEYAKNSNEKCNGNPPCHGSTIVLGDLRLGTKRYNGTINVKMQHWGCTTPDMLYDLAFIDLNRIPGMEKLSEVDKVKIHKAVQDLRIDPADIPITARPLVRGPALPSSSQGNNAPRVASAPFGSQRPVAPSPFMAPSTGASALASRKRKTSSKAKPTASQTSPSASQSAKSAYPTPASSQASGSQAPRFAPPTPTPPAYMGTQITMSQQKHDDEEYVDEGDYKDDDQFTDFYVLFHTSVVGIQYYDGLVGPGEQVLLVREPLNRYDRNAIQVMNMNNRQVGHIPRTVAANLAPLMDRQLIAVEGTMNDGNLQGRQFQLSVSLNIYGKPGVRTTLEPLLRWATPGKRGFTDAMRAESGAALAQTQSYSAGASGGPSYAAGSSQHPLSIEGSSSLAITQLSQQAADAIASHRRAEELRTMLAGLEKVDDEGRRANFLDTLYGTEAEDILNLPEHESPPGKEEGSLTVDLLKHQKQGLLWCINRENVKLPQKVGEPHQQFWEFRQPPGHKPYYMSLITKTPLPLDLPPSIGYGGIMSDSMGLGKSLTFLALILATKDVHPDRCDKPTLIVCPLSVLSNWETQIADHVTAGALTTYTYYGNNRNVEPDVLKAYDVVLTTYQSVSADFERSGGFKTADQLLADAEARTRLEAKGKVPDKSSNGLFAVTWKRVVLDEAHQIRNPKTKIAQAVTAIQGYYRWAVSGTPIVNSPTDLGSLLAFLRMCPPLDRISNFNRLLARPLSKGEASSMNLLREIMKHISIRRSKEMQNADGKRLVDLPKVVINVTRVQLDEDTRRIYNAVEALSRQRFMAMANAAQDGEHVPNVVLSLLTRMRQIALHPGLVPADYLDTLKAGNEDHAEQYNVHVPGMISAQEKARLQNILFHAEEDSEECAICFDSLKNPRILPDGHYFCYECIAGLIQAHGPEATCPMDRRPIAIEDLIEPAPPIASTQAPREEIERGLAPAHGSSAKIDRLIGILKLIPTDEKAVVFSQFTSFLDKIADQLEVHGISFVQFNGGLSAKRRQEVLQSFSRPLAVRRTGKRTASQTKKNAGSGSDSDLDYVPKYDEDDFVDDDGSFFTATQTGKDKAKASTKGKGKGKGKTTASRSSGGNPKVLLISLKSGATGLNLTVANHLFLMDPWWQEAIESQAIDRVNRIGQKRDVQVYQMITDDTVESKVLEIQARKKAMIDQAFSGMAGREVAREKRETRMQDFIDLFGLKRQGGRVTLGEGAAAAQKAIDDDDDELEWVPVGRSKRARLAVSDDDD